MKFLLVTLNGKFSQGLYPWDSMDIHALAEEFQKHDCHVDFQECDQLLQCKDSLKKYDAIVFGSSQIPYEKKILEDYAFITNLLGSNIIPRYELVLSHDNKGMQGLLAIAKGIDVIHFEYGTDANADYKPGYVYKTIDGAGSFGVSLPKSDNELRQFIKKNTLLREQPLRLWHYIKQKLKLFIWRKRYIKEKEQYFRPGIPLVSQKLIPNLKFDYKVLVFHDLFFVLKRNVRKNDFRASGSGLFEKVAQVPSQVLDLANRYCKELDSPCLSIDVAFDGSEAFCIEFQCCHFGPITYLDADVVHYRTKDTWTSNIWHRKSLEWVFAYSICNNMKFKKKPTQ